MRKILFGAGLLLVLVVGAQADSGVATATAEALHFKVEIGVKEKKTIVGYIDVAGESGDGYVLAVLDLDGDGVPETKQEIEKKLNTHTGKPLPNTEIRFEHEGLAWVLDLYNVDYRRRLPKDREYPSYLRWSVTKGEELYAWFINGKAELHDTAEKAVKGKAIRLGPPFHFEVGSRTRGPETLVSIGLKDENGATLRLARVDGKIREPGFKLSMRGEEKLATQASYG